MIRRAPRLALVVLPFLVLGCAMSVSEGEGDAPAEGAAASADPSPPVVEHLQAPGADLDLPFSEAVRVGDLLFLSGQIGNQPGTLELVEGGIRAETRQTLEHVQAIVERHGSSMARVVKCTVFLDDMGDWPAMNEVYRESFPNPPARSALGASGLALGAKVEIECIAAVGT